MPVYLLLFGSISLLFLIVIDIIYQQTLFLVTVFQTFSDVIFLAFQGGRTMEHYGGEGICQDTMDKRVNII